MTVRDRKTETRIGIKDGGGQAMTKKMTIGDGIGTEISVILKEIRMGWGFQNRKR